MESQLRGDDSRCQRGKSVPADMPRHSRWAARGLRPLTRTFDDCGKSGDVLVADQDTDPLGRIIDEVRQLLGDESEDCDRETVSRGIKSQAVDGRRTKQLTE